MAGKRISDVRKVRKDHLRGIDKTPSSPALPILEVQRLLEIPVHGLK